jgi:hypothetical protein
MWTLAILGAAALFALGWMINAVLYAPSRVKPLVRLIYRRSAWYRSWYFRQAMKRLTLAMRRSERVIGERLMPVMEKTTQAMREWLEAYQSA